MLPISSSPHWRILLRALRLPGDFFDAMNWFPEELIPCLACRTPILFSRMVQSISG